MRRHNLHLTLAFIGNVAAEQLACMRAAAAGVVAEPFELQLDRFGYWKRPRIAWLGCEQTPDALSELVASLNIALGDCGYQPESRPFQGHVTLVRKAQGGEPPADFAALSWPVTDFCLVESVGGPDGVNYEVIARWPLTGRPNSGQLDKHPV
jgi:2'-5' RNA ligase